MADNCGNETMRIEVGTLETLWTEHVRWLSGRLGPESTRQAHRHLSEHQDLSYPFSLDTIVSADILRNGRNRRRTG